MQCSPPPAQFANWALPALAVVWTPDRLLVLEYPYFERKEPLVWDDPGTYVETDMEF